MSRILWLVSSMLLMVGAASPIASGKDKAVRVTAVVVDQDGRPVPDVVVSHEPLISATPKLLVEKPRGALRTDAEGRVALDLHIPEATEAEGDDDVWYRLRLGTIRFRKWGYEQGTLNVDPDWAKGDTYDLGHIVVPQASTLGVTVQDASGRPVPGAHLMLVPLDRATDVELSFLCGKDGRALVSGIRPARYQLFVQAHLLDDVIEAELGKVTQHTVTANTAAPVMDEMRLVYRDGTPCDHAYVWIWSEEGWNRRFECDDGRLPLNGVPKHGPFRIEIDQGAMKERVLTSAQKSDIPRQVVLEKGATLTARARTSDGPLKLDSIRELPIRLATDHDGEARTIYSGNLVEGAWVCTDIPRHRWKVMCHAIKGFRMPTARTLDLSAITTVDVVFDLEPWLPFTVQVQDPDGAPIPGAKLQLNDPHLTGFMFESVTDANGSGETRWTGDPEAKLVITAPDWARAEVDISDFGSGLQEVVLSRGATLKLHFKGPDGKTVQAQMGVDLVPMGTQGFRVGKVCKAGRPLVLENVSRGAYAVEITVMDGLLFSKVLRIDNAVLVDSVGNVERIVRLPRIPEPRY